MFQIKERLSKRDRFNISILIGELPDYFGEFYLTRNRLRIFIKENMSSLFDLLSKGDKIVYGEDAIGVITGFCDKEIEIFNIITKEKKIVPSRKYVTILAKDERNANRLLEFIDYQLPKEFLFCKLKRNNPLLKVFYSCGWQFKGGRGAELLLFRPPIKENKTYEQIYKESEK